MDKQIIEGLKKLEKLATKLEKLPRQRFDYDVWVGEDWKGKPDLSCGTTACALGWATTIPEFNRAGLRLTSNRPSCDFGYGHGGWVAYKNSRGPVDAAEKFFHLTADEATYLFLPRDNSETKATPQQVAKKIRRFIKNKKATMALHAQLKKVSKKHDVASAALNEAIETRDKINDKINKLQIWA